jgi:hypothetical protein
MQRHCPTHHMTSRLNAPMDEKIDPVNLLTRKRRRSRFVSVSTAGIVPVRLLLYNVLWSPWSTTSNCLIQTHSAVNCVSRVTVGGMIPMRLLLCKNLAGGREVLDCSESFVRIAYAAYNSFSAVKRPNTSGMLFSNALLLKCLGGVARCQVCGDANESVHLGQCRELTNCWRYCACNASKTQVSEQRGQKAQMWCATTFVQSSERSQITNGCWNCACQ